MISIAPLQHPQEFHGAYFKELGLLGRSLSKAGVGFRRASGVSARSCQCVLIDNSPVSVACNAENSAGASERVAESPARLAGLIQEVFVDVVGWCLTAQV